MKVLRLDGLRFEAILDGSAKRVAKFCYKEVHYSHGKQKTVESIVGGMTQAHRFYIQDSSSNRTACADLSCKTGAPESLGDFRYDCPHDFRYDCLHDFPYVCPHDFRYHFGVKHAR